MSDDRASGSVDVSIPLNAVLGKADPGTTFSEPTAVGDSLIFTASAWERAGGFGFGGGYGSSGDEDGGGQGGGGGGAAQGRPVAVIRVTPSGVEVEPVVDLTKIGVTFLFALAGWVGVLRRSR